MKFRVFLLNLPLITIALGILFFSSLSAPQRILQVNLWDKAQHSLAFFLLGLSLLLHFYSTKSVLQTKYICLYVLIIGSLFGATDEFHQYFVPNRFVELGDWIADTIGVVISLFFLKFVKQFVTYFLNDTE